ncbi:hypothetical protein NP493_1755g00004 [Ridgeia piscesae]|uniref:Uncharacterized protein n=1 Tax=Ridgeia piscesae TaxID=27915 RepID=A0AAD9JTQ5_RIDPI|nr:hypothetical protein NP493_1755g00004 [Ridgeia piscesae]
MATTLTNGGCVRLVGGGAGENGRARDTGPVAVDDRLSFHFVRNVRHVRDWTTKLTVPDAVARPDRSGRGHAPTSHTNITPVESVQRRGWGTGGCLLRLGELVSTTIAQVVSPVEGHLVSRAKRLPALGALETCLMVGVAKSSDHLPLHKLTTRVTLGAKQSLVVRGAIVHIILAVEATCC